jgi:hypothetical protein
VVGRANAGRRKALEIDRLNEDATPAMIADAARRLGCRSVAFTYNDPVVAALPERPQMGGLSLRPETP